MKKNRIYSLIVLVVFSLGLFMSFNVTEVSAEGEVFQSVPTDPNSYNLEKGYDYALFSLNFFRDCDLYWVAIKRGSKTFGGLSGANGFTVLSDANQANEIISRSSLGKGATTDTQNDANNSIYSGYIKTTEKPDKYKHATVKVRGTKKADIKVNLNMIEVMNKPTSAYDANNIEISPASGSIPALHGNVIADLASSNKLEVHVREYDVYILAKYTELNGSKYELFKEQITTLPSTPVKINTLKPQSSYNAYTILASTNKSATMYSLTIDTNASDDIKKKIKESIENDPNFICADGNEVTFTGGLGTDEHISNIITNYIDYTYNSTSKTITKTATKPQLKAGKKYKIYLVAFNQFGTERVFSDVRECDVIVKGIGIETNAEKIKDSNSINVRVKIDSNCTVKYLLQNAINTNVPNTADANFKAAYNSGIWTQIFANTNKNVWLDSNLNNVITDNIKKNLYIVAQLNADGNVFSSVEIHKIDGVSPDIIIDHISDSNVTKSSFNLNLKSNQSKPSNIYYISLKERNNKVTNEVTPNECFDYPLDQISEAKAAYSVRRLSQKYTGPLMKVFRDANTIANEKGFDIPYDVNGNLNTKVLLDYAEDKYGKKYALYVGKWYDQTNHKLDLESTANRPMIVDSNGILQTLQPGISGARPMVKVNATNSLTKSASSAISLKSGGTLSGVGNGSTNIISQPSNLSITGIGANSQVFSSSSFTDVTLNGSVSEAIIFGKVLTANEIGALRNNQSVYYRLLNNWNQVSGLTVDNTKKTTFLINGREANNTYKTYVILQSTTDANLRSETAEQKTNTLGDNVFVISRNNELTDPSKLWFNVEASTPCKIYYNYKLIDPNQIDSIDYDPNKVINHTGINDGFKLPASLDANYNPLDDYAENYVKKGIRKLSLDTSGLNVDSVYRLYVALGDANTAIKKQVFDTVRTLEFDISTLKLNIKLSDITDSSFKFDVTGAKFGYQYILRAVNNPISDEDANSLTWIDANGIVSNPNLVRGDQYLLYVRAKLNDTGMIRYGGIIQKLVSLKTASTDTIIGTGIRSITSKSSVLVVKINPFKPDSEIYYRVDKRIGTTKPTAPSTPTDANFKNEKWTKVIRKTTGNQMILMDSYISDNSNPSKPIRSPFDPNSQYDVYVISRDKTSIDPAPVTYGLFTAPSTLQMDFKTLNVVRPTFINEPNVNSVISKFGTNVIDEGTFSITFKTKDNISGYFVLVDKAELGASTNYKDFVPSQEQMKKLISKNGTKTITYIDKDGITRTRIAGGIFRANKGEEKIIPSLPLDNNNGTYRSKFIVYVMLENSNKIASDIKWVVLP